MTDEREDLKNMNTKNARSEKSKSSLSPIVYSVLAFTLISIFFLLFNVWKEIDDRNIIVNFGSKTLSAEHLWGNGDVKVEWIVHRSNLVIDKNDVKSVQVFVEANIFNLNKEKDLSIRSITLELVPDSGVSLSRHSEDLNWQIKPDNSRELNFNYWIPVKIYDEVSSLSARLGYEMI